MKLGTCWHIPVVLATLEAKADRLLEPRGLRPAWATQGDTVSNKQHKMLGLLKDWGCVAWHTQDPTFDPQDHKNNKNEKSSWVCEKH